MAQGDIRVQVEGGEELLRKLRRLGVDVDKVLEAAAMMGAEVIARAANTKAPAPLIDTEVSSSRQGYVVVNVGPPEKKWYWQFLETGAEAHQIAGAPLVFEGEDELVVIGGVTHPGIAARPFLRPAFDAEQDGARDAVGDGLRKAVHG